LVDMVVLGRVGLHANNIRAQNAGVMQAHAYFYTLGLGLDTGRNHASVFRFAVSYTNWAAAKKRPGLLLYSGKAAIEVDMHYLRFCIVNR